MPTPRFLLSKTYSVVTPESAEQGDFAETGFEFDDRPADLRDVVRAFRECSEASTWPVRPDTVDGYSWASTTGDGGDIDYRTGAETQYAYHVTRADGSKLTPRAMYRIMRAAGLAGRNPPRL